MNNESHGNKVQALIEYFESVKIIHSLVNYKQGVENIDKAIEAIRVLQLIAEKGGLFDSLKVVDDSIVPDKRSGQWCAEQAKQWVDSI